MDKPNISQTELIDVLSSWGERTLSSDKLQEWMIDHYEPSEVTIAKGESEWIHDAMNIVMNEYEVADQEKFVVDSYLLAIEFIQSSEDTFEERKDRFIREGFID